MNTSMRPRPRDQENRRACRKRLQASVFVSDMYSSSKDVIQSLLKNAGYPELPIIVSSEFKRTKAQGSLYETLIEETGMQACKITYRR